MKIGIDAKRVFLNQSGLGSYGRNLVSGLNQIDSKDEFVLYTTKKTKQFNTKNLGNNFSCFSSQARIKAFWRSYSILDNLKKDDINLYHGISNELPFSLKGNTKIHKIVDIHDLLFIRFPHLYALTDRKMFEFKTKFACEIADKIIATSQATKNDIVNYYNIAPSKIEVVYQSCCDVFFECQTDEVKLKTRKKYNLPNDFLLCVGTIQERKNQLAILEAMATAKLDIPLVLVGAKTKYTEKLVAFAKEKKLELIFPKEFVQNKDLPALYQSASAFVFPGLYEGFGIPVLEAMASKIPIITSVNTSMAEIVQEAHSLVNPLSNEELAEKLVTVLQNNQSDYIEANYQRALHFRNLNFAQNITKVYDEFRNK